MTKDEALKLALEALVMYGERHRATYLLGGAWDEEITLGDKAIAAAEEALAQPEQEPVAWLDPWTQNNVTTDYDAYGKHGIPLYITPPQRKPLHASEIVTMYAERPTSDNDMIEFARAIEAAHGIKE